jgi:SNF2 family DNA or RNA helicase
LLQPKLPIGTPVAPPPVDAVDLAAYAIFVERLAAGEAIDEGVARLVDAAIATSMRPGFEEFVSLAHLRFVPFPHQLAAARRALSRLRGRAILADEVGLGKTIEACLVLSELSHRRLARRTLILVPPGLVEQWAEEIDRKFALPALVLGSQAWDLRLHPWDAPLIIASLATARRAGWSEEIASIEWDLVIADEAHRLRNPQSASAKLVKALRARRLLLLTATPVENRLDDLFQLVNLVRPGLLGTLPSFRRTYAAGKSGELATNVDALQRQTREVMIRHRRSEVALMLPKRLAQTIAVHAGPEEAALYAEISQRVRDAARDASQTEKFTLRAIQRAAGSSPRALRSVLERRHWDDLATRAANIPVVQKTAVLFELIERHRARDEKVIVFTGFRPTLDMLAEAARARMPVAVYHGGLDRKQKVETIRSFEADAPLLLTTEAAGEGRNLQYCHVMINYDLPWNPMQIEQRLGRIHRIGQQHDVVLTNLVGVGTLEEHILRVLESKINLFELVVGELDMILGRIDDDFDFERFVFESHVASRDDEEFIARVEVLGEDLARARGAYAESRAATDQLVASAVGE